MKWQRLTWRIVCKDCLRDFGLRIDKAAKHEKRKGHKTGYEPYIWEVIS